MKHRARPGRGGWFSRRGSFGGRDHDFSCGRKFHAEDLRGLLVALLMEEPRHGYELIRLLEARSNGYYMPSPGMVYPALSHLEKMGHASVTAVGNRKRYAITEEGRAYVGANRERIDFLRAKLDFFAQKMGLVRRALAGDDFVADAAPIAAAVPAGEGEAVAATATAVAAAAAAPIAAAIITGAGDAAAVTAAATGEDSQVGHARGHSRKSLREARHTLELLMAAAGHASTAEQLRITRILERAAADIAAADPRPVIAG